MPQVNNYDDLRTLVVAELTGCPEPLLMQELKQAGRMFCRETGAWRSDLVMNLVANTTRYRLRPRYDAAVERIIDVRFNKSGRPVGESPVVDPWYYRHDLTTGDLVLREEVKPVETTANALEVSVVLVPFLTTNELEFNFLNKWAEGIVARAMMRLLRMPGKEWTDPAMAEYYMSEYRRYRTRAASEAAKEYRLKGSDLKG